MEVGYLAVACFKLALKSLWSTVKKEKEGEEGDAYVFINYILNSFIVTMVSFRGKNVIIVYAV